MTTVNGLTVTEEEEILASITDDEIIGPFTDTNELLKSLVAKSTKPPLS